MAQKAQIIDFLLSQVRDSSNALIGGTVTFYTAGTTTPATIWTDRNKSVISANPVTLDGNATCAVYGDGLYRAVIKDASGTTVYDRDNLSFVDISSQFVPTTKYITDYASLNNAITSIGSTPTTLCINAATTLITSAAIPSTMQLLIEKPGTINISPGQTLTINGPFTADIYQVFIGSGAVSGLSTAYVEWFGSSTTALQSAINAASNLIINTAVTTTATVTVPSNRTIKGIGSITNTTVNPILKLDGASNVTISDISFTGMGGNNYAIKLTDASGTPCSNVKVHHTNTSQCNLIQTEGDLYPSPYSGYNTEATLHSFIYVNDNKGYTTNPVVAGSVQFIRITFARDFEVNNNIANGYRDFIVAFGGDYAAGGWTTAIRNCYRGIISGNVGTMTSAGIWTACAKDLIISNNIVKDCGNEAYDAEGSADILFSHNQAINVGEGITLFGSNSNITFDGMDISASSNAFRNAQATKIVSQGVIRILNSKITSTSATIPIIQAAIGHFIMRGNTFTNVYFTTGTTNITTIEDNEFIFQNVPSVGYLLSAGNTNTGWTDQVAIPKLTIARNKFINQTGASLSKRGLYLTAHNVANTEIIVKENIIDCEEPILIDAGGAIARKYSISRNHMQTAVVPFQYASGTGDKVIWVDNYSLTGLDAYGVSPGSIGLSVGSRIWANTPASGNPPGWINTGGGVAGWSPMANLA